MCDDDHIREIRIALGGVGDRALRVFGVEKMIQGVRFIDIDWGAIADALNDAISPISDVRASADYRQSMAIASIKEKVNYSCPRVGHKMILTRYESSVAHVTGQALFVDDVVLPEGALHIAVGVAENPRAELTKSTWERHHEPRCGRRDNGRTYQEPIRLVPWLKTSHYSSSQMFNTQVSVFLP